ncbi:hypothetical protein EON79_13740 [bacterium]|nr:MAG: hypothetical protein EON79_13740 [bacterium]
MGPLPQPLDRRTSPIAAGSVPARESPSEGMRVFGPSFGRAGTEPAATAGEGGGHGVRVSIRTTLNRTFTYRPTLMSQDIGVRGEGDQNANLVRGNTELLVLAVLRDGPAYGYAIAKEIERRAQGALSLKQGSIYPLLYALEEGGLVSSGWSEAEKGQRPRRMYSITEAGTGDLERRLEGFLAFSQAILRTAGLQPDGRPVEERT